jgi:hypothetical protein
VVFGSDEWTTAGMSFGTPESIATLTALAETGATHVRLIVTWYQDTVRTTKIYPILPPSALASTPLDGLETMIVTAQGLGLNVTVCPIVDPSWDIPTNGR